MKIGSLFTGAGGIELGLKLAGEEVDLAWWAEDNEDLATIRLPGADHDANLGDVSLVDWLAQEEVDLITAGFPCQPVSVAGGGRGAADPRWMWPEVVRCLTDQMPPQLLIENVPNLAFFDEGKLWHGMMLDLATLGYGVRWLTLGACHVGCAHHRHRLFLLATLGANIWCRRVTTSSCAVRGRWDVLPTPTASVNSRDPYGESLGSLGVSPRKWSRYERALALQATQYGPSPEPTEIGLNGMPRLSAKFTEWLMCLPPGHVTDRLERQKALKTIGNAVCPPQLARAWKLLKGED